MKKIVIHKAGDHRELKFEEHEDLSLSKENEILVDVYYSGVNYADICVRWGIYESAKKYVGWPITPGFEFSGIVKAIGKDVKNFKVGDEVLGVNLFNSYASQVLVPEHQLYHKPENITFSQAACFPAVYMTAYHGLFQHFIFRQDTKVLIHSAAGGVGTSLVQLAKWHGAHITGVVGSSHKVDYVKDLGADQVIDKSCEDLWKRAQEISPEGYDVILDANGVSTIGQSFKHLAPTGKLVVYGFHTMLPKGSGRLNWPKLIINYLKTPRFNPIDLTSANKSIIAFNLSFLFERKELLSEAMDQLLSLVETSQIKAHQVTEFSASECAKAHALIESGQSTGKIALKWI